MRFNFALLFVLFGGFGLGNAQPLATLDPRNAPNIQALSGDNGWRVSFNGAGCRVVQSTGQIAWGFGYDGKELGIIVVKPTEPDARLKLFALDDILLFDGNTSETFNANLTIVLDGNAGVIKRFWRAWSVSQAAQISRFLSIIAAPRSPSNLQASEFRDVPLRLKVGDVDVQATMTLRTAFLMGDCIDRLAILR